MLADFSGADHIYITCGYTDLRRGIDGLASIVSEQFQLDPLEERICLCCNTQMADLSPEERYKKRLEQVKPVLDELFAWAKPEVPHQNLPWAKPWAT